MPVFETKDDQHRPIRLHPAGLRAAGWLVLQLTRGRRSDLAMAGLLRVIFSPVGLVIVGTVALLTIMGLLLWYETAVGVWMLIFSPVVTSLLVVFATAGVSLLAWSSHVWDFQARAMLALLRCPGCNYDLSGLAPSPQQHLPRETQSEGPEAMITCPECAAVWRLSRLGEQRQQPAVAVVVKPFHDNLR